MIMSHYPNSGQNENIRIANEWFENTTKYQYLWTTLTNQNDFHEEMKSRLISGNAYYYSVQSLLSPVSYQKTTDYNIQSCNFASFLYGCETWSVSLREVLDLGFLKTEC